MLPHHTAQLAQQRQHELMHLAAQARLARVRRRHTVERIRSIRRHQPT